MSDKPFSVTWTGEVFSPASGMWSKECAKRFTAGETYRLNEEHERSLNTHNHYFACVNEAWKNLDESVTYDLPTPEHLRKWALIMTGYRQERHFVCATKAEAVRMAAFIRPMDEHAVIVPKEATVTVMTAESQSMKAMGKARFQESKTAVLDYLSKLIGTSVTDLKSNARNVA